MNFEWFIAKHVIGRKLKGNRLSGLIINIAILAIALSLAVMIISVSVLQGFQTEIKDKVAGFASHIQISNYQQNNSYEWTPIKKDQPFLSTLKSDPAIRHVQVFAQKAGILKTEEDMEGVILKGIGTDFDWTFFNDKVIDGKFFRVREGEKSDSIVISKKLANRLGLKLNDAASLYFIQQPPRVRKFYISGIYESGLEDFDNKFLFADIGHIQKLNDWDSTLVGGFEIFLNDFSALDKEGERIYEMVGYDLNARTVTDLYPQIFDWLNLTDMNVQVILILMIIVAVINMSTALLILILERTNFIGTLKALGASNWSIRKIFLYHASVLISRGLLWGNLVGIGTCYLQLKTGMFELDQESYYMQYVPVQLDVSTILLLNIGTLVICVLIMLLPSFLVTRISPVKAIRFA